MRVAKTFNCVQPIAAVQIIRHDPFKYDNIYVRNFLSLLVAATIRLRAVSARFSH